MTIYGQADHRREQVFGDRFREPNPVDHVYAVVICIACPRCKADMGDWCVNPITKKISKIPCKDRIVLGEFPDDVGIVSQDQDAASEYCGGSFDT